MKNQKWNVYDAIKFGFTLLLRLFLCCIWMLFVTSLFESPAYSNDSNVPPSLPAVKTSLSSLPLIDGKLDDNCWKSAPKAAGFEDTLLGTPVPDQTVAHLLYDATYIYIGLYCYDSQPDKIAARQTKEGARLSGEDIVAFGIDPFHNHRFDDRSFFIVNPLGTKFAKIASGRAQKTEWIGKWEAKATIVKDGWTAEMKIPWGILDYPNKKQPITMGINFDRYQQRTGTHSWWANIGPHEFYEKEGHWVGVEPPPKRKELSLLPFGYFGMIKERSVNKLNSQIGLDAKYPLTSGLNLVTTVNPDFSNVEQAVESIDFSYGERFVPDRRPFFQEGGSIYNYQNTSGLYLHTRRIPQLDLGLNLYGKLTNRTSVGILSSSASSFQRQDVVLRAIQDFSTYSNLDFSILHHHHNNNNTSKISNQLLALGGSYRWKQFIVGSNMAQSVFNDKLAGATGKIRALYLGKHLILLADSFFIDPDFTDEIGFFPFLDQRGINAIGMYSSEWHSGTFRKGRVIIGENYAKHYNGALFQNLQYISTAIDTHSDYSFSLGWNGGRFEKHRDRTFEVGFKARASDRFNNYGFRFSWGKRAGFPIRFFSPSASIRIEKLTMEIESQLLWHRENRRQHIFTFNYDFAPQLGIAGRMISHKDSTNFYLAFRRSGYAGIETFIILGDLNASRFQRRLVAKVIAPF